VKYRQDIAECVARLRGMPLLGSRSLRELPDHLYDGETVKAVLIGAGEGLGGALALTDQRIVWSGGIFPLEVCDEFPFDAITGISVQGFFPRTLTLRGSGAFAWDETPGGESDQEGGIKHIVEVNRKDAASFMEQVKLAIPNLA
jgi:hypothetical protein